MHEIILLVHVMHASCVKLVPLHKKRTLVLYLFEVSGLQQVTVELILKYNNKLILYIFMYSYIAHHSNGTEGMRSISCIHIVLVKEKLTGNSEGRLGTYILPLSASYTEKVIAVLHGT